METDYIECLLGLCVIFIIFGLESLESLKKIHITAITCVGWTIYILFAKGGLKWHF